MAPPSLAGFCIVRNATLLDFPFEASVASVLPAVDEFVLAVGHSTDDTLERARAIGDPRVRLIQSEWDFSAGAEVLSIETNRAMRACRSAWGIAIQADEILEDGGAERLRARIAAVDGDPRVEGVVVHYLHFYGGFDRVVTSRSWYRREVRAVRLTDDIRSDGDAQGFRVGPQRRRVRCVRSGVTMFHYGAARPTDALRRKREHDRAIYPTERAKNAGRPLLPWTPGLRGYRGPHPAVAASWIASRRHLGAAVEPARFRWRDLRIWVSLAVERSTGWRPFEFRNYTLRT
jgi:hypothetical protein